MIRVALPFLQSNNGWMGGLNYVVNLAHAVQALPNRQIEFVLLSAPDVSPTSIAAFPPMQRETTTLLAGKRPLRVLGKSLELALGRNMVLEHRLRRLGVSAISHAPSVGRNSRFPSVIWIPDFQHIHLPDLFSAEQIAQRDLGFRRAVKSRSTILVSSVDAQNDLAKLAPEATSRSRVLRFVSGFSHGGPPPTFAELKVRYGLREAYLHLPNQFWKHKNHLLVVDAVAKLASRGVDIQIVCTGHTDDARHPEYFGEFQSRLESSGVSKSFRILGVVPYADLRGLMLHSAAVLNPSQFEGWSTSVEEGKSLGKMIILSNIAVHKEQAPERSMFFNPKDSNELADKIEAASNSYSHKREDFFAKESEIKLPVRFSKFGNEYQDIIIETIENMRDRGR